MPFLFTLVSIAVATFVDDSDKPVFPRWFGWFSLFALIAFLPGQTLFFFRSGLFAWNGIFGWWMPFIDFFGWPLSDVFDDVRMREFTGLA